MIRLLITVVLFWLVPGLLAGQTARTSTDTALVQQQVIKEKGRFKKNWKQPYPNPLRAGIYSLILPGAGQIYNRRYWKAPLVWGAVGGVIYMAVYNSQQYNRFNTAYGLRTLAERTNTAPTDEFRDAPSNVDAATLKRIRDNYDRNRQVAIFASIGVYALNALEAYVDAHLKNFDIDDDLAIQLRPTLSHGVAGVGLKVSFR